LKILPPFRSALFPAIADSLRPAHRISQVFQHPCARNRPVQRCGKTGSRYIYTALQGGSIMHGWMNDDKVMIACCNDGTRPVIFKIERIDVDD